MSTAPPKRRIRVGYEPIVGYELEEMLGRGGFGEVWRSSAPGGLKKAVKFVHGNQDQAQALRELKSLERIKTVRHPFLLTLERIEFVDEQLVVVTELADKSLEDLFRECREAGSCGIGRDVLLSHLHDAADALDYLHQAYQLQHLDIKPGNLLLVGGHVKVADFGLLKDLRDTDCSMIGGLTPVYAPPELFDGRPSIHSDQYSLAVMYQELLTGTRPFSGRTIAQLATQHVHRAPNLELLPPADRPVAARALEKDPQRRFPSCKVFIESLRESDRRIVGPGSGEGQSDRGDGTSAATGPASQIENLPDLHDAKPHASASSVRSALLVALGGTGAEVLCDLRHRVGSLHGASIVNLHSVLIDTDMSSMHDVRVAEVSDRVPKCHTVFTPLRSAHEYRKDRAARFRSVSRRWLYNVPRNGSTEGMRPLGRLAMVDHGPLIKKRLTDAIDAMGSSPPGECPTVYVVGSLSGGTASGMYIDIAHLLRHLLDEAGLHDSSIRSIMSTAPLRADPGKPLAMHDSQAALVEINHFLHAGNAYPGDSGATFPPVPAARTPLHDLYIIAAAPADTLTPPPVRSMAEYVWADATGAGPLLAAARKTEPGQHSDLSTPTIRTVGVIPLGDGHRLEQRVITPAIVRKMLVGWLGWPARANENAPGLANRWVRRVGIGPEPMRRAVRLHLADTEQRIDEDRQEAAGISGAIMNTLHREISLSLGDRKADLTTTIASLERISEVVREAIKTIHTEPTREAEDASDVQASVPTDRLPASRDRGVPNVDKVAIIELNRLVGNLNFLRDRLLTLAARLAAAIDGAGPKTTPDEIAAELHSTIGEKFARIERELHAATVNEFLIRVVNDRSAKMEPAVLVDHCNDFVLPKVIEVVAANAACLADRIKNSAFDSGRDDDTHAATSHVSRYRTEGGVADRRTSIGVTQAVIADRKPPEHPSTYGAEDALIAVRPTLLAFGGLQRLLLVVGSDAQRAQLETKVRALHRGPLTVAVIRGSEPKLIHEAQKIKLNAILSQMSILNGNNAQITGRLGSRCDVAWT